MFEMQEERVAGLTAKKKIMQKHLCFMQKHLHLLAVIPYGRSATKKKTIIAETCRREVSFWPGI